jgi:hypothetical protein
MAKIIHMASAVLIGATIAGLAGCDNSEKAPPPPPSPPRPSVVAIGGSVSGLPGSGLILQLNGANDLAVSTNGRFSFPKPLTKGSAYSVTVKSSPSSPVKQTCTVGKGSGNITGAAVNNIVVTCVTNSYAVGGMVSGLSGKGLVLQLNGTNEQPIARNGKFIFPGIRLPDGSDYSVAIKTTPARQKCIIKPINGAFDKDTLNIVSVTCSKKGRRK